MRSMNNYFYLTAMVIFLLPGTVSLVSCASELNSRNIILGGNTDSVEYSKTAADYSDIYRLSDPSNCSPVIIISKKGDEYCYSIKGSGLKSSGKLSFESDEGQTYIYFKGTLCSGDETPVTGYYNDKTIVIQNYGNAMNQYVCFKSCDSKYLEFVKSE